MMMRYDGYFYEFGYLRGITRKLFCIGLLVFIGVDVVGSCTFFVGFVRRRIDFFRYFIYGIEQGKLFRLRWVFIRVCLGCTRSVFRISLQEYHFLRSDFYLGSIFNPNVLVPPGYSFIIDFYHILPTQASNLPFSGLVIEEDQCMLPRNTFMRKL